MASLGCFLSVLLFWSLFAEGSCEHCYKLYVDQGLPRTHPSLVGSMYYYGMPPYKCLGECERTSRCVVYNYRAQTQVCTFYPGRHTPAERVGDAYAQRISCEESGKT
ncbi:hypothetical protein BaRGS_00002789 [Batillaria attramentaria]|uniref:Apple domain-containing protein n=1 Tax=Batillaria attramentaria TaxID=370345 RepID=A0ABD0M4A9_9CAEN